MTADTKKSAEIPDCEYHPNSPSLITPHRSTPTHSLYLSNLDDQKFLRFSIKYLYLYEKGVCVESLKLSLSRILTEYYPLAGRLRASASSTTHESSDYQKLEVDCNGEGALFAEAYLDLSVVEFLEFCGKPNKSWRKLLYKVDALCFLDVPPLVVQESSKSAKTYPKRCIEASHDLPVAIEVEPRPTRGVYCIGVFLLSTNRGATTNPRLNATSHDQANAKQFPHYAHANATSGLECDHMMSNS
uniref:Uncharacterized protein n=1 Tax=Chenopodium quinoa TaxID=63459 RepID=A0A803MSF9_CHEQI